MLAQVKIDPTWKESLQAEFEKPYFQQLIQFVRAEYSTDTVFPAGRDIFRAFDLCPLPHTRVVIIGQDPYHGPGQAHGLCFSVPDGVRPPPSLQNIFKEIRADLGQAAPPSGNLERWARQGVLLLNSILTVRAAQAGSHQNRGWEVFTDEVIRVVAARRAHVVFLLWGAYAQRKGAMIDPACHRVLSSAHPSPFSAHAGFFGNRHFSQTNAYLRQHGLAEIVW